MKSIELVKHSYEEAQRRTLYTKDIGAGRQLTITVWPLSPLGQQGDYSDHIELAYDSVLWTETSLYSESLTSRIVKDYLREGAFEGLNHLAKAAVKYDMLKYFPHVKADGHTAYICPVKSQGRIGFHAGYVIGWDAEDTHDVAEYLAGGRVELACCLVDTSEGKVIDTVPLGELSYSDVAGETDNYRLIIEGENLMQALEDLEGIEPPTPANQKYPGAESLATFTKLA